MQHVGLTAVPCGRQLRKRLFRRPRQLSTPFLSAIVATRIERMLRVDHERRSRILNRHPRPGISSTMSLAKAFQAIKDWHCNLSFDQCGTCRAQHMRRYLDLVYVVEIRRRICHCILWAVRVLLIMFQFHLIIVLSIA
jgi:hypothetical protein